MAENEDLKWNKNDLEEKSLEAKEKSGLEILREKNPHYADFVEQQLPKTRTSIEFLKTILENAKQKLEEAKRKMQEFANKQKEEAQKTAQQSQAPQNTPSQGEKPETKQEKGEQKVPQENSKNIPQAQEPEKKTESTPLIAPDINFANLLINEVNSLIPKLNEQAEKLQSAIITGEETIHSATTVIGAAEIPDVNLNEPKENGAKQNPKNENGEKGNKDNSDAEKDKSNENPKDKDLGKEQTSESQAPQNEMIKTQENSIEQDRPEATKEISDEGTEKPKKKKELSDAAKIRNLSRGASSNGRTTNSGQSSQRPIQGVRPPMKNFGR